MKNWSRYHCECRNRVHQRHYVEGSIFNDATRIEVEETRCCACGYTYQTRTNISQEPSGE